MLPATLGWATHGLLDACTSYGTHLGWPFDDERAAWNVISILDPLFTLPLLWGCIRGARRRTRLAPAVGLGVALAYLGLCTVQHARAVVLQGKLWHARGHQPIRPEVKPSILNNLVFRSYEGGEYWVDAIRVPWWGRCRCTRESVSVLDVESLVERWFDEVQRRDLARFRHFSDGFLIEDRRQAGVVGGSQRCSTRSLPCGGSASTASRRASTCASSASAPSTSACGCASSTCCWAASRGRPRGLRADASPGHGGSEPPRAALRAAIPNTGLAVGVLFTGVGLLLARAGWAAWGFPARGHRGPDAARARGAWPGSRADSLRGRVRPMGGIVLLFGLGGSCRRGGPARPGQRVPGVSRSPVWGMARHRRVASRRARRFSTDQARASRRLARAPWSSRWARG